MFGFHIQLQTSSPKLMAYVDWAVLRQDYRLPQESCAGRTKHARAPACNSTKVDKIDVEKASMRRCYKHCRKWRQIIESGDCSMVLHAH